MRVLITLLMAFWLSGCASRPDSVVDQVVRKIQSGDRISLRPDALHPEPLVLENHIMLRNAGLPVSLAEARPDAELAEMLMRTSIYHGHWNNAWHFFEQWVNQSGLGMHRARIMIRLLAMLGEVEKAGLALKTYILLRDREDPELWVDVANLLFFRMDTERGQQVWDAMPAPEEPPGSPAALRNFLGLMLNLGKVELAVQSALELARTSGKADDWRVVLQLTRNREAFRQVEMEALRQLQALEPGDRRTALSLALRLIDQQEYQAAVDVLSGQPGDLPVWGLLVLSLSEMGRREEAMRWFERMEASGAEDDEQALQIASAARMLELHERALYWLEQVQGEQRRKARITMAMVLSEAGRHQQALSLLQALFHPGEPDQVRLVRVAAHIAIQAGQEQEALRWYALPGLEGEELDVLRYEQAMLLLDLQRVDEALAVLKRLMEEHPDELEYINAYAYTLVDRTRRLDEAEPLLEKVVQTEPDNAAFLDSLGWLRYRQGRFVEAERILRRALALDADPEISAHLAEVLWKLGREQAAREMLERALEQHPDHDVLRETANRLLHRL